jgi:hypothetical protein
VPAYAYTLLGLSGRQKTGENLADPRYARCAAGLGGSYESFMRKLPKAEGDRP